MRKAYKYIFLMCIFPILLLAHNACYSADINGKYSIVGPGIDDCSTFLETIDSAKKTDNWTRWNQFRFYTLGYFTGVNEFKTDTYDIKGDKRSTDGTFEILDMIESYCRKNPDDIYFTALRKIVSELYPQRLVKAP